MQLNFGASSRNTAIITMASFRATNFYVTI